MNNLLNIGQNVGKWVGQVYPNTNANAIGLKNEFPVLKKPDSYKSINSCALLVPGSMGCQGGFNGGVKGVLREN
jgi:hypothetical protein